MSKINIKELVKLNWDIQSTFNNCLEIKIIEVGDENMPYTEGDNPLMFVDYQYKLQGYMMFRDELEPLVYICPRDEEPTQENLIEFDHRNWSVWEIRCASNVTFRKGDSYSNATAHIYRNGELFDTIGGREMHYSLIEAQAMIHKLDNPYRPWSYSTIDFEKGIIGLKCKWRGKSCTITSYIKGQNAVMLDIKDEAGDYIKDWLLSDYFDFWEEVNE